MILKTAFVVVMHKCSKCSRNSFDVINNFIESLYKFCKEDFILYLFDNESDEKYDVPNHPNIKYTYIKDQSLRKLAGPHNDGYEMAIKDKCDVIISSNDDIVLNETINNFINVIRNHKHKNISLYGPLTNGVIGKTHQKALKAGKGIQEITNENGGYGILNGFFWGFTKEFHRKFKLPNGKLLDENYMAGGEKILINHIKRFGGRVFIIKNCWVFHHKFREWKLFYGKKEKRKK